MRVQRTLAIFLILSLLFLGQAQQAQPALALSADVVISQVYGGGGNSGATLTNDFIELFNRGAAPVDITGWSVQYASSTGTTWAATTLSGTIQPGQYYLVQEAQGTGGTTPLPTPDATGNIAMSATSGKVALVDNGVALSGSCPTAIDFVGFGSANCFEGSATPALSNTTAALRNQNGCMETDVNSADFTVGSPNPRNTSSPLSPCSTSPSEPKINEFSASTAGTDVEYVEFIGDPNTDYSAYTLLEIEGDTNSNPGVVDEVLNLGTTGASGLYLANLPANALENGTLSLLLVQNFTGAFGNDLDTDNDGVLDVTPWIALVDAVSVTYGGITYGVPALGPNYDGVSGFTPGGASRIPDGFDTDAATDWVRNDFDLAGIPGFTGTPQIGEAYNTPGAPNALVLPQLVINEIDYDQPGTDAAEFVEIRNNSMFDLDLSGVSLELVNGSGGAIYGTFALPSISLAAGNYFVVCANAATVANCDLDVFPDTNLIQNGAPDAVGLRWNGYLLDAVSYEGDTIAPYTEGSGVGLVDDGVSATQGISRCPDGVDTNVNNLDLALKDITPGAANICDVPPVVASTSPADGTTDAALAADIAINFSEAVTVSGSWYDISCSLSGNHLVTVSGGPQDYLLNPDDDFVDGDNCTVTIYAAQVVDQDYTPDYMAADYSFSFTAINVCVHPYTHIYDIQGSGLSAAITGAVTTQGVVVGDYEVPSGSGQIRGFYIQDLAGDNDPTTSDGIFVYNGGTDSVNLGDVVRVTGNAGEFQGQTQISSVSTIAPCGTGNVEPADVILPFADANFPERYEGMLVRLPQTLYVTEHYQLGRFGMVWVSSNGRLQQPTNVVAPGAPALALQAANDLNRIIIDDGTNIEDPDPIVFGRGGMPLSASNTLRGGDTATGIVGVMTYNWAGNSASGNAYRVRPINALNGYVNFEPTNPRPTEPPAVGGSLNVTGMNLLNFFNTFGANKCTLGVGGGATDCRGADDQFEFDRQWVKSVAAILKVNPDVLGINEIENDGYGPDSALQFLVDRLNDATAPGTYAFIDVDANTGQVNAMGTDAIKVGLIYKPGVVTPVGQTAALNTTSFVTGGDSEPRNRPALAQAFEVNASGANFVAVVNHLKSKGSACDAPDAGDGQGNCNQVRVNAATELVNWLASDPTGISDVDVLLIGDYNSYAMEDPITTIKDAGFSNLVSDFLGPDAYSYVFDGQWGYLDQALGSQSLSPQVTGVADYHINSDEPSVLDFNDDFKSPGQIVSLYAPDEYRVSDHDPVLVGLDLLHYNFSGFFRPVDNPPEINVAKAGSSVPLKFSLAGFQGLDIFLSGYPLSIPVACDVNGATSTVDQTATAGNSALSYDPDVDQYNYVWQTDGSWSGTCRQLVVILKDGSVHTATFEFK